MSFDNCWCISNISNFYSEAINNWNHIWYVFVVNVHMFMHVDGHRCVLNYFQTMWTYWIICKQFESSLICTFQIEYACELRLVVCKNIMNYIHVGIVAPQTIKRWMKHRDRISSAPWLKAATPDGQPAIKTFWKVGRSHPFIKYISLNWHRFMFGRGERVGALEIKHARFHWNFHLKNYKETTITEACCCK